MKALVELQNLSISVLERPLIKEVNVTVFPERVTALCGPSGSGKSLYGKSNYGGHSFKLDPCLGFSSLSCSFRK